MQRESVEYSAAYEQVMQAMTSHGLLLGSYDPQLRPNIMTIGWGGVGHMWGMPIWMVMVRPSRLTYQNLEHTGCFSVNVPGAELGMACATCGSKSGRDLDKFDACSLTGERGKTVLAPIVDECPIVYECQVVHSHDVQPSKLAKEILDGAYTDGDFHRVYYGKILATYAATDAEKLLR